MRTWTLTLAIVALAAAAAWAQNAPSPTAPAPVPSEISPPAAAAPAAAPISVAEAIQMKQAGTQTLASEHVRCVATCATVVPYYQQQYATLQSHDGDTQCWANCWNQFGDRNCPNPSVDQQRQLWRSRSPQYMRINQCAQTCWRKYHPQDSAVMVAGLASLPRPIVAAMLQAASQVFPGQPICLAAAPMIMVPTPPTIEPPAPCPPQVDSAKGRSPVCPSGLNTY